MHMGVAHSSLATAMPALLLQDKTRLDVARLQRLTSGFGAFTVAGIPGQSEPVAVPAQVRLRFLRCSHGHCANVVCLAQPLLCRACRISCNFEGCTSSLSQLPDANR